MVAKQDYTWEQGNDLIIEVTYKVNNIPVDLTNHSVRMDIAPLVANIPGQTPILSLNSDDFDSDNGLDLTGDVDNEVEVDALGNIRIKVARAITLPGGAIGNNLASTNTYAYDMFVRDNTANVQTKLMEGKITVNKSITRWV